MSDKTTSAFGHEFKRLIEEFETSGHLEETAKEKGLAMLNLLRDIVRLRLKHFPNETIPIDDDREFAEWLGRLNDPNPEHATFEAFALTDGVATVAGAAAANLDTLAEFMDAVEIIYKAVGAAVGANLDGVMAFEFDGGTYLVDGTYTNVGTTFALDNLTCLSAITAIDTSPAATTLVVA